METHGSKGDPRVYWFLNILLSLMFAWLVLWGLGILIDLQYDWISIVLLTIVVAILSHLFVGLSV